MMRRIGIFVGLVLAMSGGTYGEDEYDIVIYGGTSAGVIAAVQAVKMGKTAVIVGPDVHLGGLSSGGLGWTDTGNKAVIGGLARDFYHRIYLEYEKPEVWKWQRREEYGNKGQGTPAIDGDARTMWIFEPSVAEKVFEDYVREFGIPVHRDEWLDREGGVEIDGGRIKSVTMLSGLRIAGKMFLDASYEGDLMAAAGVDYHVGREGREVYGEEWNGVQTGVLHHRHHFDTIPGKVRISPYRTPGDPSSGILPRISGEPPGEKHSGDDKVQAYCFRMCLTNHPENRVPLPKPEGYDPDQYELLLRILDAGWREVFAKFDPIPNRKTDTNNHGPFSTDNIGYNYDYPEASYERRAEIVQEHVTYQQGLLYFLANDPRVPADVREKMGEWGLPKDEFEDNGHWSHQLYVREARRMVGAFVMTEHELLKRRETPDPVGMGSYTIDSHNVQRYITPEGYVQNEGDIGVGLPGPYEIAFGSLVPRREQCQNLLVPVCVSSSHIAFGSIRMEPVFMILGQSAATAAAMAIDRGLAVQDVPYDELRERLLEDGQVLEHAGSAAGGVKIGSLGGIVVDDGEAELEGAWSMSASRPKFVGAGYRHEGGAGGGCTARFVGVLPEAGQFEVRMSYSADRNRGGAIPIRVRHEGGVAELTVDQRKEPPIGGLMVSLGTYQFAAGEALVEVSNDGVEGHVVIDAVQWLREE